MKREKVTVAGIKRMKQEGKKIAMLTAYDYSMAKLLDSADIDIILVGDSLGNVVLGYDSTVPVSMDEMIHHTKAVSRGISRALLVGDMPFMSYNVTVEKTIENAGRFIKEAGADCVKLEGANDTILSMIKAITSAGIPVMGHIGLTPQTANTLGGFKVQGKNAEAAKVLLKQAHDLEGAGCFSIVFECIPEALAEIITKSVKIPTIGIGAGINCDGQVLVINDMLGMYDKFVPKFVKQYANLSNEILSAVKDYIKEVKENIFPDAEHSFKVDKEQLKDL